MTESEARSKIKYRIGVIKEIAGNRYDDKFCEDLEIALQVLKEIREYRELGTVEELKDLKENERKCEDCAGCTVWKCDCANERAYAIDEFAKCLKERWIETEDLNFNLSSEFFKFVDKIAEQMKGGVTDARNTV